MFRSLTCIVPDEIIDPLLGSGVAGPTYHSEMKPSMFSFSQFHASIVDVQLYFVIYSKFLPHHPPLLMPLQRNPTKIYTKSVKSI